MHMTLHDGVLEQADLRKDLAHLGHTPHDRLAEFATIDIGGRDITSQHQSTQQRTVVCHAEGDVVDGNAFP